MNGLDANMILNSLACGLKALHASRLGATEGKREVASSTWMPSFLGTFPQQTDPSVQPPNLETLKARSLNRKTLNHKTHPEPSTYNYPEVPK